MNGVKKLAWGIVLSAAVALGAASAWAGGEMPSGYTEIEYIQGPGNARIVTDYMPQPNTDKIEAVVEWPSGTLNANQAVWCARGNGTQVDSWTLFYLNDNGKFRFDYMPSGNAVSLQPNFAPSALTKYTITAEDNTVTYSANGSVLQSQNTPAYSFTSWRFSPRTTAESTPTLATTASKSSTPSRSGGRESSSTTSSRARTPAATRRWWTSATTRRR